METEPLLETARALLTQPTAPFHQDAVRTQIEQLLAPPRLFTRAELAAFICAIHHAKSGLLQPDLTIVSHETSSEKGGPVRMGEGVIIRVGDRTSIFDSDASATLVALARLHAIPHQRALMQGGTCEATAYQLYGYRSAGLCVALANSHNCAPNE